MRLRYPPLHTQAIHRHDKLWQMTNTGYRNPLRLSELLGAIRRVHRPMTGHGNWQWDALVEEIKARQTKGTPDEQDRLPRLNAKEDQSLDGVAKGLKLAEDLGFIHPQDHRKTLDAAHTSGQELLTPAGRALADAFDERTQSWLLGKAFASSVLIMKDPDQGVPLMRVAELFAALRQAQMVEQITQEELALAVMTRPWSTPVADIVAELRAIRQETPEQKRIRIGETLERVRHSGKDKMKPASLMTYAHSCFMALRSTGLFTRYQGASALVPHAHCAVLWAALAQGQNPFDDRVVLQRQRKALEAALQIHAQARCEDAKIVELLVESDKQEDQKAHTDAEALELAYTILKAPWVKPSKKAVHQAFLKQSRKSAALEWAVAQVLRQVFEHQGVAWNGRANAIGAPVQHAPPHQSDGLLRLPDLWVGIEVSSMRGHRQVENQGMSVLAHAANLHRRAQNTPTFTIFVAETVAENNYGVWGALPYYRHHGVSIPAQVLPLTCEQLVRLSKANLTAEAWRRMCRELLEDRPSQRGKIPVAAERLTQWEQVIENRVKQEVGLRLSR